jgi:hypothetical protein
MTVAALYRLLETMHTPFGEPRLLGQREHAEGRIVTKTLGNPSTFVPKSQVGLFSEESLHSWWHAVLQRTQPTPLCPALSGYPVPIIAPPFGHGTIAASTTQHCSTCQREYGG